MCQCFLSPGEYTKCLADLVERERRTAYRAAYDGMRSERYTLTVLRLLRWFETRGWRQRRSLKEAEMLLPPIGEIASAALARRRRQVRKLSKNFTAMTSAERHLLRIALKKLRYTVELFSEIYDAREVSGYLARLEPLQDALGLANDLRVARELVAELCQGPARSVKPPAAPADLCLDGTNVA
jgi:CHAD domain-containing protein